MIQPAPSSGPQAHDSGAVAGRDVVLTGTNVAGRDIIIHQQTVQVISAPTVVPCELPMAVTDFIDRHDPAGQLCELLDQSLNTGESAVMAISGAPGVGKTALALFVAHKMGDRFGGNLFMDLAGGGATSLAPSAVLGELLL